MEMSSEWILAALEYDNFVNELESAFVELNKDAR